jgi:hypothetical protein
MNFYSYVKEYIFSLEPQNLSGARAPAPCVFGPCEWRPLLVRIFLVHVKTSEGFLSEQTICFIDSLACSPFLFLEPLLNTDA